MLKKYLSTIIIFGVALLLMLCHSIFSSFALEPTIKEKDFSFSITYEYKGVVDKLEGTYTVKFIGNENSFDVTDRVYEEEFNCNKEVRSYSYVINDAENEYIVLDTNFDAYYLMGDPQYKEFFDGNLTPEILCCGIDGIYLSEEEALSKYGVKIIEWEYPEPIENSFVFSHIAIFDNSVVFPLLLIASLALICVIIFVKKDEDVKRKPLDIVSLVFNICICVFVLPTIAVFGVLQDIAGTSSLFNHQLGYFIPALIVLGIAASIVLRRKGFSKIGFIVQFIPPLIFVVNFAIMYIFSLY